MAGLEGTDLDERCLHWALGSARQTHPFRHIPQYSLMISDRRMQPRSPVNTSQSDCQSIPRFVSSGTWNSTYTSPAGGWMTLAPLFPRYASGNRLIETSASLVKSRAKKISEIAFAQLK